MTFAESRTLGPVRVLQCDPLTGTALVVAQDDDGNDYHVDVEFSDLTDWGMDR